MIGPLALAAAAIAALFFAREHELWSFGAPGAGLLPVVAAVLLLVLSLLVLRERPPADAEPVDRPRIFKYGAGLLALPPAILAVGMLPALGVFVLLMLRLAEGARWRTALVVAVASTALCWLLFVYLLHVPLPVSAIW